MSLSGRTGLYNIQHVNKFPRLDVSVWLTGERMAILSTQTAEPIISFWKSWIVIVRAQALSVSQDESRSFDCWLTSEFRSIITVGFVPCCSPVLLEQLHSLVFLWVSLHVALQAVHVGGGEIAAAAPVADQSEHKKPHTLLNNRKLPPLSLTVLRLLLGCTGGWFFDVGLFCKAASDVYYCSTSLKLK